VKEAGEVGRASFVTGDEPPRILEPREEPLDAPPTFVASEGPAVLGEVDAIASMRRNQLDAAVGERLIEAVAVIGGIADQAERVVGQEAGV
jgi:hypothetical protein